MIKKKGDTLLLNTERLLKDSPGQNVISFNKLSCIYDSERATLSEANRKNFLLA